jgi:hypothetical protein
VPDHMDKYMIPGWVHNIINLSDMGNLVTVMWQMKRLTRSIRNVWEIGENACKNQHEMVQQVESVHRRGGNNDIKRIIYLFGKRRNCG